MDQATAIVVVMSCLCLVILFKSELHGESFGYCLGASLGLSVDEEIDAELKVKGKHCDKTSTLDERT